MLHYYDKYYIISLKLSNNALKNFKVSLRKGEKSMKKEFILRTEAVLSSEKATIVNVKNFCSFLAKKYVGFWQRYLEGEHPSFIPLFL